MEIFRIIFFRCTLEWQHPFQLQAFMFTQLSDGVMVQADIGNLGFLKVLVLQWNSRQCFLIYTYIYTFKIKLNPNISHLQECHQNAQNGKSLFWGKKTKTCSEQTHLASGSFWRYFIRRPPVQDDHFWVVPRVVVLNKFDCMLVY